MQPFSFCTADTAGASRTGTFVTPHGEVHTPAFMPVATQATVRGLSMDEVRATGAQMVLSNALHLYLRPGDALVRDAGGVQAFSRWRGPMLTDSGGFQVFSLAKQRVVREEGVEFRSPVDGSLHQYTPELAIRIQRNLGADVIMQLDELVAGDVDRSTARRAMQRSLRWLDRCRAEFVTLEDRGGYPRQALFPIVQGGTDAELRRASMAGLLGAGDWHGVAIGGVSVGEPKPSLYEVLEVCDPVLPRALPRYLMGVGFPDDLVESVRRGVDLFDCVVPTRLGRHGTAFTPDGTVQVRKGSFRHDRRPLVEGCTCPCCAHYDRQYLRHLYTSEEELGLRLVSLHNVHFLVTLMATARREIVAGNFSTWSEAFLARYRAKGRAHDGAPSIDASTAELD